MLEKLDEHKGNNISNLDEDEIKISLEAEGADPTVISKNLAELLNKVSSRNPDQLVR